MCWHNGRKIIEHVIEFGMTTTYLLSFRFFVTITYFVTQSQTNFFKFIS